MMYRVRSFLRQLFKGKKPGQKESEDHSRWIPINSYFRHKHASISVLEADTYLYVNFVEVRQKRRGQGVGTLILKRILYYANRKQKDVVLVATDLLGSDLERLITFYERMGFQQGKLNRVPYKHNMFFIHH